MPFDVNDVSLIGTEELKSIADEFKFPLPDNQKFVERLRNLFYLREYVQQYSNIDKQGNYKEFIDLLWKKRIQNTVQKRQPAPSNEKNVLSALPNKGVKQDGSISMLIVYHNQHCFN